MVSNSHQNAKCQQYAKKEIKICIVNAYSIQKRKQIGMHNIQRPICLALLNHAGYVNFTRTYSSKS